MMRVARVCAICGADFTARPRDIARGFGRFCSRRCHSVSNGRLVNARHPQAGAGNFNFKGWASRNKRAYVNGFRARNPEKAAAHDAVAAAIRAGRLVRPQTCPTCGAAARLHAHHDDYAYPLAVVFACRACHRTLDADRRVREGRQQFLDRLFERVPFVQLPVAGEVR